MQYSVFYCNNVLGNYVHYTTVSISTVDPGKKQHNNGQNYSTDFIIALNFNLTMYFQTTIRYFSVTIIVLLK